MSQYQIHVIIRIPEGGEMQEIMKRNKAKSFLNVMTDINFRYKKLKEEQAGKNKP